MSPLFSSLGRSLSLIRQPLTALRLSVPTDEAGAPAGHVSFRRQPGRRPRPTGWRT